MGFGSTIAVLVFLGLSFAAFSSLISMIELATRAVVDAGVRRTQAVGAVCAIGFVMGIPSAVNLDLLGNQDFVWGVGLMISGAFVAFAVLRYGLGRFRTEIVDATEGDWNSGRTWEVLIGWTVPLMAVVLLAWWLFLAATVYAPDTWYDPLDPYSVMTCLVQWGAVIGLLLLVNRSLSRRTLEFAPPEEG
jgi:NSS family neurotransmitter:Na+ symporter